MAQKQKHFKSSHRQLLLIVTVLAIGALGFCIGFDVKSHKRDSVVIPPPNTPAHIFAEQAKEDVDGFYREYTKPNATLEQQAEYLTTWGDKNLEFYNEYYQHGFNPIVCAQNLPESVTVLSATSGPVSVVKVKETFGRSSQILTATVVVNNEGLKIDSITCPGGMGSLPPASVPN